MTQQSVKTGYLHEDFRVFYLESRNMQEFESHYHDFHKILLFLGGSVSYYIEGETYQLQPYDVVLVRAGEVHHPVIHDDSPYRRLILYISADFLACYLRQGVDLGRCFSLCAARGSHVLRIHRFRECRLYPLLSEMIATARDTNTRVSSAALPGTAVPLQIPAHNTSDAVPLAIAAATSPHPHNTSDSSLQEHAAAAGARLHNTPDPARQLYQRAVLLQFLLLLAQLSEGTQAAYPAASGANPQILKALSYINQHLTDELSIDRIAAACYLNRSYLMHLFRKETGYTIGAYIAEKRLFAARTLIQAGVPVTDACLQSGFPSYSSFYRAYRKKFKEPPTSRPAAQKIK